MRRCKSQTKTIQPWELNRQVVREDERLKVQKVLPRNDQPSTTRNYVKKNANLVTIARPWKLMAEEYGVDGKSLVEPALESVASDVYHCGAMCILAWCAFFSSLN